MENNVFLMKEESRLPPKPLITRKSHRNPGLKEFITHLSPEPYQDTSLHLPCYEGLTRPLLGRQVLA